MLSHIGNLKYAYPHSASTWLPLNRDYYSMLSMQPTCVPLTGPAPRHGIPLNGDYYSMLSMQPTCVPLTGPAPRHGYPSTGIITQCSVCSLYIYMCSLTGPAIVTPPLFGVVPRYFPSFGEYTTYFYSLGLNEGPQHLRA